jgi:dihydropteroate synthase
LPVASDDAAGAADIWVHRRGSFKLDNPLLMGVLNVTPDSFSDGGRYDDAGRALAHAEEMVAAGAGLIDVGGESTRPGATPIDPAEETARILPVVRALRGRIQVPISVDTRRAIVARAALDEGVDIVNDVSALADPDMAPVVAGESAGLVLMHMRGTPQTMQTNPRYADVAGEVRDELADRLRYAVDAGIERRRIAVDPGVGFGKTFTHNLELIARLGVLAGLRRPIVLGVSRKAFLGELVAGAPPEERAVATAAACVAGLFAGARVFRVHDVGVVNQALQVAAAVLAAAPAHPSPH